MTSLVWDAPEERFFETGVDHGVLYMPNVAGEYVEGVAWNGLTGVTESPSGAEPTKTYADNILYATLFSVEEFAATIEAYTCPDEFWEFDGVTVTAAGMQIGQQRRPAFGFSFRTNKGNSLDGELGYILHLVYGCQAAPSEKAYKTINDSPEMTPFSWALTTTPVPATGFRPTAIIKVDSTDVRVNPVRLSALETVLYGSVGVDPRLPLPDEVDDILATGIQLVTPTMPAYDAGTNTITFPATAGIIWTVDDIDYDPSDTLVITENKVAYARPAPTYNFTGVFVDEYMMVFS